MDPGGLVHKHTSAVYSTTSLMELTHVRAYGTSDLTQTEPRLGQTGMALKGIDVHWEAGLVCLCWTILVHCLDPRFPFASCPSGHSFFHPTANANVVVAARKLLFIFCSFTSLLLRCLSPLALPRPDKNKMETPATMARLAN